MVASGLAISVRFPMAPIGSMQISAEMMVTPSIPPNAPQIQKAAIHRGTRKLKRERESDRDREREGQRQRERKTERKGDREKVRKEKYGLVKRG